MNRQFLAMSIALAAVIAPVHAQTPVPIVVPAASGATVSSQPQVRSAVAVDPNDPAKVLQQLQQMKAANEETIRKQEAMLQHLDELQKSTEQLRILISRS
jgi:hypothetical protein